MVLNHNMNTVVKILLFIILTVCFSCEDIDQYIVNCSECHTNKPVSAVLEIQINSTSGKVFINIYEGNIEDNIIYDSFSTLSSGISHSVPLYKTYTLTATYSYYGNQYTTVSSVVPRVKYVKDLCEEPCYVVYNKMVDLKLKYTK